jgi:hypothetical protein
MLMSTVFFAFVELFAHFIWTILHTCLSGMIEIVMMKIFIINVMMMLMLMLMKIMTMIMIIMEKVI